MVRAYRPAAGTLIPVNRTVLPLARWATTRPPEAPATVRTLVPPLRTAPAPSASTDGDPRTEAPPRVAVDPGGRPACGDGTTGWRSAASDGCRLGSPPERSAVGSGRGRSTRWPSRPGGRHRPPSDRQMSHRWLSTRTQVGRQPGRFDGPMTTPVPSKTTTAFYLQSAISFGVSLRRPLPSSAGSTRPGWTSSSPSTTRSRRRSDERGCPCHQGHPLARGTCQQAFVEPVALTFAEPAFFTQYPLMFWNPRSNGAPLPDSAVNPSRVILLPALAISPGRRSLSLKLTELLVNVMPLTLCRYQP